MLPNKSNELMGYAKITLKIPTSVSTLAGNPGINPEPQTGNFYSATKQILNQQFNILIHLQTNYSSPHFTCRNLLYQINFLHSSPRAHAHCRFRALPQAQPSTPILPWPTALLHLAPAHKPPDAPAVLSTQYAALIGVTAVAIGNRTRSPGAQRFAGPV